MTDKITKSIRLPADLARALDTYCAMRGESMSSVIARLVSEMLAGEDLGKDAKRIGASVRSLMTEADVLRDGGEVTHRRDADGYMRQVVSAARLRRILDDRGVSHSRPEGFEGEWNAGKTGKTGKSKKEAGR